MKTKDKLVIGGHEFDSRFILGSGKYSMKLIEAAVRDAGAQIITLAVRRANTKDHENILDYIPEGVTLLPNTSGARNAQEAHSPDSRIKHTNRTFLPVFILFHCYSSQTASLPFSVRVT